MWILVLLYLFNYLNDFGLVIGNTGYFLDRKMIHLSSGRVLDICIKDETSYFLLGSYLTGLDDYYFLLNSSTSENLYYEYKGIREAWPYLNTNQVVLKQKNIVVSSMIRVGRTMKTQYSYTNSLKNDY